MTPRERRARTRDWVIIALFAVILAIAAVAAMAALVALRAASQNAKTIKRIEEVRADSRDQSCTLFERTERSNVLRVRERYAYLDGLDLADRGASITKAIIQGLPDLEREATEQRAPPYCNAPGVGLPEPAKDACRRLLPSCLDLPAHRDFRELLKPAP